MNRQFLSPKISEIKTDMKALEIFCFDSEKKSENKFSLQYHCHLKQF